MACADGRRRLIVNADDFGRSHEINQAVVQAHANGILTTTSLMVNGEAFDEAVRLARQFPTLGIGLHLTLVCGRASLTSREIPGLVDANGSFSSDPVNSGLRLFFLRSLGPQLEREIEAQLAKFAETGLVLDHLNGHLNMHLHPSVFRILMRNSARWNIHRIRLTADPLWLNLRLDRGRLAYRLSHAVIFGLLSRWAKPALAHRQIRHTPQVFGLLQTGHVDESYLLKLLPQLPKGDSELYSHPSLGEFKHELGGLLSDRVRQIVLDQGIRLIRYQDL
jgi:hopanoid biosynthesis associated protein HpnK